MQREGAHADDTISCSADYLQRHLWIGEYLVLQWDIVSGPPTHSCSANSIDTRADENV